MRIAIAGVSMEALTRSPFLTQANAVQVYRDADLLARKLWLIGGMTARLKEEQDVEIVPLIWATALPGGPMALDIYHEIKRETLVLLEKNGPFDGVLLANHGALEVEGLAVHGDTDFITAVRDTIGTVPLAIAFDLHGNLTPEIARAGTVFSALRTAPHRDDHATGYRAADQLLKVIRQRIEPKTALVQIPILIIGEAAVTHYEPAKSLYASLGQIESLPGVMQAILMVGFAWHDAPYSGMSVMVTTADDAVLASRLASELARRVWASRMDFRIGIETAEIDQGIERAIASRTGPVFLSDAGDNTTAGAPGDVTVVLQRLLTKNVIAAAVVGITAPQTVRKCHEAGPGAKVDLELGSEHISIESERLRVTAIVEAVGDQLELPGFQPYRTREGAWTRVRIGDIVVTFHALPIGITTPDHFQAMGIGLVEYQIYVVKLGYLHPQLEDVVQRHIILRSPGVADLELPRLVWCGVRRPIYPLDPDMVWSPDAVYDKTSYLSESNRAAVSQEGSTNTPNSRLQPIRLPDFGTPDSMPEIPSTIYRERANAAQRRGKTKGLDVLVIYADREHSANVTYLTGFDPRFEEALLILGTSLEPAILVGNECYAMAGAAPLAMRRHLYQHFSLPGQPRDRSEQLTTILAGEGVGPGKVVGVVGWKTYPEPGWSDLPAYIIDTIRGLVKEGGVVKNATEILIDAADGLRVVNEVEQLAAFEYAACHTSDGLKRIIFGLKPGMSEREAVRLVDWNGLPLSCHLMLSSGPRASFGLLSPSDRRIERGDRFTVAFGQWGALNSRAGFVVAVAKELPEDIRDYVERLVAPYFAAVAEWYATLRIGVTGGALQAVIDRRLGDKFFGISLNPGHQIHLDEWVNSPIYKGSEVVLRSGMALQVDVIPATGTEYFTTNIEDGVALADEALQAAFAEKFPTAWRRIQARRRFMRDCLGIALAPEVLPFSNIPAYLPPFLLRPEVAMTLT